MSFTLNLLFPLLAALQLAFHLVTHRPVSIITDLNSDSIEFLFVYKNHTFHNSSSIRLFLEVQQRWHSFVGFPEHKNSML